MVRPGYVLTSKEASEVFLILSVARLQLNGSPQTMAKKYWEKFEDALGLKTSYNEKNEIESKTT